MALIVLAMPVANTLLVLVNMNLMSINNVRQLTRRAGFEIFRLRKQITSPVGRVCKAARVALEVLRVHVGQVTKV
jgi:hypothetical protein